MPPPKPATPYKPSSEVIAAITLYLAQKPDFDKLIEEARQAPAHVPNKRDLSAYDQKTQKAVQDSLTEAKR